MPFRNAIRHILPSIWQPTGYGKGRDNRQKRIGARRKGATSACTHDYEKPLHDMLAHTRNINNTKHIK